MLKIPPETKPKRFTISELAEQSGVVVATIKFYLRAGLLEPGELTAPQRAYYGEGHLNRLALIQAMRNVAGLSVARVRELVRLLGQGHASPVDLVSSAVDALAAGKPDKATPAHSKAKTQIERFLSLREIKVRTGASAMSRLVSAMVAIRSFEPELDVDTALGPYLDLALAIAKHELSVSSTRILEGPESALIRAVVGTVLWEPVILALRRIASEHYARHMFGDQRD